MLEFLFGWIIGIWAAQQFTLPSVQDAVIRWWNAPPSQVSNNPPEPTEEDHESTPIFTGDMPSLDVA